MQSIKNLDKKEREQLFNDLNDAASQIQHKLYQEDSKSERDFDTEKKSSDKKSLPLKKKFLYPLFERQKSKAWIIISTYPQNVVKNFLRTFYHFFLFLFIRLPLRKTGDVTVQDISKAKTNIVKVSKDLFNFHSYTVTGAFAQYFFPIYLVSMQVVELLKEREYPSSSFLEDLTYPYVHETKFAEAIYSLSEENILQIFQTKGILAIFDYTSKKQKEVLGFLAGNLPKDLEESFFILELLKNLGEFVEWGYFFQCFGSLVSGQLVIKKKPKAQAVLPYLAQIAYVLKTTTVSFQKKDSFVDSYAMAYEHNPHLHNVEKSIKELRKTFLLALEHLEKLINFQVVDHMILLITQYKKNIVLGLKLSHNYLLRSFILEVQGKIIKIIKNVREMQTKKYTQHVSQNFLGFSNPFKDNSNLYTEENSDYLKGLKLEGFTYSVFLPVIFFYFKHLYGENARPFFNMVVYNISYQNHGFSQQFLDEVNALLWIFQEFQEFVNNTLLSTGKSMPQDLFNLLQLREKGNSIRVMTEISSQIIELNLMIQKYLKKISEIMKQVLDKIFLLKDDILIHPHRIIDNLQPPLSKIKGKPFTEVLYQVTTEFNILIELMDFYFAIPKSEELIDSKKRGQNR